MLATDNVALVRKLIEESWNKGNFNVIDEIVSPSCTGSDPMLGDLKGRDSIKDHVRTMRTAFPDLQRSIDSIGFADGHVYVRWIARGTHRGNLFNMAGSGNRATLKGISIVKLDGGKISEVHDAWDTYGLLVQLGITPTIDKLSRQAPARA